MHSGNRAHQSMALQCTMTISMLAIVWAMDQSDVRDTGGLNTSSKFDQYFDDPVGLPHKVGLDATVLKHTTVQLTEDDDEPDTKPWDFGLQNSSARIARQYIPENPGEYLSEHRRRRSHSCTSFENNPRAPPSDDNGGVDIVPSPWTPSARKTCKLFKYIDSRSWVCSGSLIKSNLLITAAHCVYNGCNGGWSGQSYAACGYGPTSSLPNGHAHFGVARIVSCTSYDTYRESLSCATGSQCSFSQSCPTCTGTQSCARSDEEYDIMVCKLSWSVGDTVGHYGYNTNSAVSNVNVRGYPGNAALNAFYAQRATDSQFIRYHGMDTDGSRMYELDNAWIWGGESGCPYYRYDSSEDSRYVVGVHRGGATGCHERGRKVTDDWHDTIQDLDNDPKPAGRCQLVQLAVDIYNGYSGRLSGVQRGNVVGPAAYTSTSIIEGSWVTVTGTLYNVGNADTTSFTVRVGASTSSTMTNPVTVDQFTLQINANSRHRYTRRSLVTELTPGRTYYFGFFWGGSGCYAPTQRGSYIVDQHLYAGSVRVDPPTTTRPLSTTSTSFIGPGSNICGTNIPVQNASCPVDPDIIHCRSAAYGELCEGDGECNTDSGLNNCDSYDIYLKQPLGYGECGNPQPISNTSCPAEPDIVHCLDAEWGELCEGDGECNTNNFVDNCGSFDVYRKIPPGAGICTTFVPVHSSFCPPDPHIRNCLDAAFGQLCEGDGECGTNQTLDNCDDFDIYHKGIISTMAPILSSPTVSPTIAMTSTLHGTTVAATVSPTGPPTLSYHNPVATSVLTCGDTVTGTTLGLQNIGGEQSGDALFYIDISAGHSLARLSTCNSSFDTWLHLIAESDAREVYSCDDCNSDQCSSQSFRSVAEFVQMNSTHFTPRTLGRVPSISGPIAAGRYIVVVEGFGGAEGNYSLSMTCERASPSNYLGTFDGNLIANADMGGEVLINGHNVLAELHELERNMVVTLPSIVPSFGSGSASTILAAGSDLHVNSSVSSVVLLNGIDVAAHLHRLFEANEIGDIDTAIEMRCTENLPSQRSYVGVYGGNLIINSTNYGSVLINGVDIIRMLCIGRYWR